MSAALIAVVVALLLGHRLPEPGRWRRFDWFDGWRRGWDARLGAPAAGSTLGVLLLLLPVFALAVLQALLSGSLFGLPSFLLGVAVLFACWGPRDLDRDVEAVLAVEEPEARRVAARPLFPDGEPAIDGPALVDAAFSEALRRWFGVLLWFLLLGPSGALLYRLSRLIASAHPPAPVSSLATLRNVLDWPAAQLMTLALALAASFDSVLGAWRDWHIQRGEGWFVADNGFLFAAARASVVFELAAEARADAEDAADAEAVVEPVDAVAVCSVPALRDAMSLIWRVLVVWLTGVALFVLGGFVG